jgi:NhaP-type Na+/H+ or K+/H+ antiporter
MPARAAAVAAWFGPKGFASVVYGLFIAEAEFARSAELVDLIAATVVVSIVAHSSTDVATALAVHAGRRPRGEPRVTPAVDGQQRFGASPASLASGARATNHR